MEPNAFDRFCLRLGRGCLIFGLGISPLILAEGTARLLHQPAPTRRVYDPYAYRIPEPLLVDEFETLDGERVTVRLNELGMRGPPLTEPPPAGTLTLVFLGGSTTENYAFPRAETFPELVARDVERELGRPVRAFNAGMSAGTTATSLGRLQHQVLDLEPSLIVVMHGINDLVLGFHPGFRRDGRHLPRPPVARAPRSFLWDWIRERWSRRLARRPRAVGPRRQVASYAGFPALDVFERNLRSMAAIADAHGLPILFLTQATRYRLDADAGDEARFRIAATIAARGTVPPDVPSLARGMQAFNAAVLAIPEDPRVHVFDLAARLPRSEDLIYDECHFTRAGNRRVAAELAPVVQAILSRQLETSDGS